MGFGRSIQQSIDLSQPHIFSRDSVC